MTGGGQFPGRGESGSTVEDGAVVSGPRGSDLQAASLSPLDSRLRGNDGRESGNDNQNPLAGITEEELGEVNSLARELEKAQGQSRQQRRWIARKLKMSLATLDRKVQRFKIQGVRGLVRKARNDRGRPRVGDNQIIARIKAEYLKTHRPPISEVHRMITKDYEMSGLKTPSYSFVRHVVDTIPPDLVARFRIGEREYDDKFAYITLRRKPERPREWVDADHHPCDHMVVFPDGAIGRPWLTAAQDLCTNEILGFLLSREKPVGKGTYPGATAIGLTLRQAIMRKGQPRGVAPTGINCDWPSFGLFEHLYVDLGKDFRSQQIRAVCHDLHIKIVHTRGYHGKSKPIERWFGVMETQTRHLPGWCGSSPEENPERQKLKPGPLDRKQILTIEEYEAELRKWIVETFHHAASRALGGLSPTEMLQSHVERGFSAREVRDERALDLLLMRRARRPGEGVKLHNYGFSLFGRKYFAPEILALVGQQIEPRYDESNLGEVIVYHDNHFVCVATNKEMLTFGASKETLEREREIKRGQKRQIAERYEELQAQAQYPDPLARAAAEQRYEQVLKEEREKIAAGARAEGIPMLLPKYQQAAKKLRIAKKERVNSQQSIVNRKSGAGTVDQLPLTIDRMAAARAGREEGGQSPENPWLAEQELPKAEEIFKRERNPWVEEDGNGQ